MSVVSWDTEDQLHMKIWPVMNGRRASKGTAAVSAWCQGHSKPQQRGTLQHGQCKGSVCVREEGVGAADRDSAGGQVVKRTSVSLVFHRKK